MRRHTGLASSSLFPRNTRTFVAAAGLSLVAGGVFSLYAVAQDQPKPPAPASDPASQTVPGSAGDGTSTGQETMGPGASGAGAAGQPGAPVAKPGVAGAPSGAGAKGAAQPNPKGPQEPNAGKPVRPGIADRPRPNASPKDGGVSTPTTPAQPASPTNANRPASPAGANGAAGVGNADDPELPGATAPIAKGNFRYGPFPEPIDLKLLANEIARHLGIQYIGADTALANKQAYLPTALDVPADQLMAFLALILDQNGMTIKTTNVGRIYIITPSSDKAASELTDDKFSSTQIIPTPGIKPSSLATAIATLSGGAAAQPGQPGAGAGQIGYLDDLGVIVVSDSPRKIGVLVSLIKKLVEEQGKQEYTPFPLHNLSANSARIRVIEFLGRPSARAGEGMNINQSGNPQVSAQGPGTSIANLPDRLYTDPNSNSLIFRGRADEAKLLQRLLTIIDVPNALIGKWYAISGAAQIAQQAKRQGFGDIITIQTGPNANPQANNGFQPVQPGGTFGRSDFGSSSESATGPVMVIDGQGRGFMYYSTAELHRYMDEFVKGLEPFIEAEAIVYEHYKIRHGKAEDIETIVRALVTSTVPTGSSTLLPGAGQTNQNQPGNRNNTAVRPTAVRAPGSPDAENLAIDATSDVFIIADKPNSQVIVKAPKRMQGQFGRLINRLDMRRPQVFIEAQIVVVDDNDGWTLAFETQLIKVVRDTNTLAGRTQFGQGGANSAGNVSNLLGRIIPNPVANAATFALIKSDQVPLVITALANSTNGRIVAAPRLLVDDNEEAEVTAIREIPTTTTSQSGAAGSTVTSFGGFQEAGPKLKVTPQISSGDYLRIKYELELSSFLGTSTDAGSAVPPARSTTKIRSDSVTVPSDSTIVVGGLSLEDVNHTTLKVPFLGDIPIVGQAFRSDSESKQRRRIYVFITPRVMRDSDFSDVRLLSKGPIASANLTDNTPEMMPAAFIPIGNGPELKAPAPVAPKSTMPPLPYRVGPGGQPADDRKNVPPASSPAMDTPPVAPAPVPPETAPTQAVPPTQPPAMQPVVPPDPVRPANDPTASAAPYSYRRP